MLLFSVFSLFLFFFTTITILIIFYTHLPHLKKHTYKTKLLSDHGTSLKILHLSDLHLKRIGLRETLALCMVRKANPDIIVITGDLIDTPKNINKEALITFLKRCSSSIPVIIIRGNAEFVKPNNPDPLEFSNSLANVRLLSNQIVTFERNGMSLYLIGLDPYVDSSKRFNVEKRTYGFYITGGGSWVDCFYNLRKERKETGKLNSLKHFILEGRIRVSSPLDLAGILVCNEIPLGMDKFYRLSFGGGYPIV